MAWPTSLHAGSTGASVLVRPRRVRLPGSGAPPGGSRGNSGGGGGGGGRGGDGEPSPDRGDADGVGRLALSLALAGISTLFLVLIAVCLFLRRPALDWKAIGTPGLESLWISTACLAASSAALEAAARSARRGRRHRSAGGRWLLASLVLGATFLGAQVLLWLGLVRAGLVPAASGYAAVFFALTSLHALHVLGGLGFLAALSLRGHRRPLQAASLRLAALYWHFMGGIWLVLFTLLYFVR